MMQQMVKAVFRTYDISPVSVDGLSRVLLGAYHRGDHCRIIPSERPHHPQPDEAAGAHRHKGYDKEGDRHAKQRPGVGGDHDEGR